MHALEVAVAQVMHSEVERGLGRTMPGAAEPRIGSSSQLLAESQLLSASFSAALLLLLLLLLP
jgi:hypothetical protein